MPRPTNLPLWFADSFEHYETQSQMEGKWVGYALGVAQGYDGPLTGTGAWEIVNTHAYSGTRSVHANSVGTMPIGIVLSRDPFQEIGCWVKTTSAAFSSLLHPFDFRVGNVTQVRLEIGAATISVVRGDGTTLGSAPNTLDTSGAWNYLALKVNIDAAPNGRFAVTINGSVVLDISGLDTEHDTRDPEIHADNVVVRSEGSEYYFDDFYLASYAYYVSEAWVGPHRIETVWPNTLTADAFFGYPNCLGGVGALNEGFPDEDSSYVAPPTALPYSPCADFYAFPAITLGDAEWVHGICPWYRLRNRQGGVNAIHTIDSLLILGGMLFEDSRLQAEDTYAYGSGASFVLGSANWTEELLNEMHLGFKTGGYSGSGGTPANMRHIRVTQLVLEVVIGNTEPPDPIPNLAAVFIDSFEHYQTDAQLKSKWGNADYPGTGTWYIGNSPSGDGLQAITAINTEEAELTAVLSTTYRDHPTWEVGCWINAAGASGMTIPVRPFILGRTGPSPAESVQCYVQINNSRQIEFRRGDDTLLATSTYVLPLYQKIHLAAKIHIDNAAGGVRVKANGVTVLTADSLDTRTDATYTGVDFVRIRSNDTNVLPFYFEDYYITKDSDTTLAGAWLGFHRIPICRPNASASPNEWDYAGAASHHQAVGEVYADEHVSYVQITNGDGTGEERYLMGDLNLPLDDEEYIALVAPWWQSHNLLGGGSAIPVTLKAIVNAITYTTLTTPETTWDFDTLSDTAFADIDWTEALVNGAQLGMVATAPAGTPGTSVLKVSQVLMEVLVGRPFALTGAGRTYGFITKAMPQVPIYAGLLEDVDNRIVDFFGSQLVEDNP